MSTPAETCRTCDGLGYVETAAQDSRVIHHEPCPDCGGPVPAPSPLVRALVQEYADVLARRGPWQRWTGADSTGWRCREEEELASCQGARHALERVATRLGVTDRHARAAEVVARGEELNDRGQS